MCIFKQELYFLYFILSKGQPKEVALYDRRFVKVSAFTGLSFWKGDPGSIRLLYNQ